MSDRLRAFFSRLRAVFSKARLDDLLTLAAAGIDRLIGLQRRALEARGEKTFLL